MIQEKTDSYDKKSTPQAVAHAKRNISTKTGGPMQNKPPTAVAAMASTGYSRATQLSMTKLFIQLQANATSKPGGLCKKKCSNARTDSPSKKRLPLARSSRKIKYNTAKKARASGGSCKKKCPNQNRRPLAKTSSQQKLQ